MVLLAAKPLSDYPEGVYIPEDEIHDGMFREARPGITQFEIIELWDEHRDNETSGQLRRRYKIRCPKCRHRSWTKPLFNMDAVRCRWGHVSSRLEMIQAKQ